MVFLLTQLLIGLSILLAAALLRLTLVARDRQAAMRRLPLVVRRRGTAPRC